MPSWWTWRNIAPGKKGKLKVASMKRRRIPSWCTIMERRMIAEGKQNQENENYWEKEDRKDAKLEEPKAKR